MIKIYYYECDDDTLLDFFEDNELKEGTATLFRGNGYQDNKEDMFWVLGFTDCTQVLTNDLDILDYCKDDAWNKKEKRFEIFIHIDREYGEYEIHDFINVHDLTDKELRKSHNIRKIYINGGFNKCNVNAASN